MSHPPLLCLGLQGRASRRLQASHRSVAPPHGEPGKVSWLPCVLVLRPPSPPLHFTAASFGSGLGQRVFQIQVGSCRLRQCRAVARGTCTCVIHFPILFQAHVQPRNAVPPARGYSSTHTAHPPPATPPTCQTTHIDQPPLPAPAPSLPTLAVPTLVWLLSWASPSGSPWPSSAPLGTRMDPCWWRPSARRLGELNKGLGTRGREGKKRQGEEAANGPLHHTQAAHTRTGHTHTPVK